MAKYYVFKYGWKDYSFFTLCDCTFDDAADARACFRALRDRLLFLSEYTYSGVFDGALESIRAYSNLNSSVDVKTIAFTVLFKAETYDDALLTFADYVGNFTGRYIIPYLK